MKIISWNVNGIRSILTKNKDGTKNKDIILNNTLHTLIKEQKPDIIALQEIRCSEDFDIHNKLGLDELGYKVVSQNCSKSRKGYSGTLVLSNLSYNEVVYDFPHIRNDNELNKEGRVITIEFPKFIFINTYVPNSKPDLSRLDFRIKEWETNMRIHINAIKTKYNKPIIITGDFNVAPSDIDVHNPKAVKGKHGFTEEEKQSFKELLEECQLINCLRYLYPTKVAFTWWSNFAKSRERNIGWTIDHFLVSSSLKKKVKDFKVYDQYYGSDHAPISLDINE